MKKIAIFDFCETLVDFQTADAFVDYVSNNIDSETLKRRTRLVRFLRESPLMNFLESLTFHKLSLRKRIKLWQLRGVEECVLESLSESYYYDMIKPHIIKRTLSLLKQHQLRGDEVWIISGGYGIYLKHFMVEFGIDRLLSSNIKFKNGKCIGSMKGLDCMRENKVKCLNRELGLRDNVEIVASYSDSYSDLPILSVAENKYVVSRSHQLWADEKTFIEIFWN